MEALVYYVSPVIGFLFMLTLIMSFVRMAGGYPIPPKLKYLLMGSFTAVVLMLLYVSVL